MTPDNPVIHVRGLACYCHHGVTEAERKTGQRIVFDLTLEPQNCAAVSTDRLEDTVDYREVCRQVVRTASAVSHLTLERVGAQVADDLMTSLPLSAVRVSVRKPQPPLEFAVESVGIELERRR